MVSHVVVVNMGVVEKTRDVVVAIEGRRIVKVVERVDVVVVGCGDGGRHKRRLNNGRNEWWLWLQGV